MTAPYADLIERLTLYEHREGYDGKDWEKIASEAAKAIEALQADLETRTREYACAAERADDEAGRSLAYLGEIEALQAEVERLSAAPPASVGWQEIGTIPDRTRVLVWVTGRQLPGVRFGTAYRLSDGRLFAKPEGANGDWSKDVTHWMPLPPRPRKETA